MPMPTSACAAPSTDGDAILAFPAMKRRARGVQKLAGHRRIKPGTSGHQADSLRPEARFGKCPDDPGEFRGLGDDAEQDAATCGAAAVNASMTRRSCF